MVTAILFAFGAFFNSVMDALENENFFESIFKSLNQNFWYKRVSWTAQKKILGYRFDAWHLAKSLMIISIVLALISASSSPSLLSTGNYLANYILDFAIYGLVWNITFTFFYHIIFKIK